HSVSSTSLISTVRANRKLLRRIIRCVLTGASSGSLLWIRAFQLAPQGEDLVEAEDLLDPGEAHHLIARKLRPPAAHQGIDQAEHGGSGDHQALDRADHDLVAESLEFI